MTNERMSVFFRCLLVLTLAYLIGLGGGLATDNADYRSTFQHLPEFSQLRIDNIGTLLFERYDDHEYGFVLLSMFIKKLGFSPIGFCFVIAIITNTLIVKSYYYQYHNSLVVFIIFLSSSFFAQEPNLIRQTLAISIFVYSLRYIIEKKWKPYLLCVCVMFLIHHSSIITLLFLPFCLNININVDIHKILRIIFLGLWIGSILISLGKIILDLSGLSLLMIGSEGYDAYLTDENRIGTSNLEFSVVYNMLALLSFLFKNDKKEWNIYTYCFWLGIIIQNISVQFINIYRMSLYFSVISPVVISEMIYDFMHDKSHKVGVVKYGLSIFIILVFIRSLINTSISNSEYIGMNLSSLFDIF